MAEKGRTFAATLEFASKPLSCIYSHWRKKDYFPVYSGAFCPLFRVQNNIFHESYRASEYDILLNNSVTPSSFLLREGEGFPHIKMIAVVWGSCGYCETVRLASGQVRLGRLRKIDIPFLRDERQSSLYDKTSKLLCHGSVPIGSEKLEIFMESTFCCPIYNHSLIKTKSKYISQELEMKECRFPTSGFPRGEMTSYAFPRTPSLSTYDLPLTP